MKKSTRNNLGVTFAAIIFSIMMIGTFVMKSSAVDNNNVSDPQIFNHSESANTAYRDENPANNIYEQNLINTNSKHKYKLSATQEQNENYNVSTVISLEQAKEIAIDHADADSASVEFNKAKLDKGVYELKFSDNYGKYEYEISAGDGQILDYDLDIETHRLNDVKNESADIDSIEGAISTGQAYQAALDAAGLSEENLKFITGYVLWKQHVPYAYEVKFSECTPPYSVYRYTIDLYTGDILDGGCMPMKK